MFSFLYRVFYDRTLFAAYVKNGRGYGIKLLFLLTCFSSMCVVVRLFFLLSSVQPRLIDDFTAQVPEIVFKNGVISSPEDMRYVYVPENKSVFFVMDTTSSAIDLKNLPQSGIYITKDALTTVRHNEMNRIPFVKFLRQTDFVLGREEIASNIKEAITLSGKIFPPMIFFFCLPGLFGAYLFMSFISFIFSFPMGRAVGTPLTGEQRIRLSVLSVTPVCVVNGMNMVLNTGFSPALLGSTVLMVFLYCFLKDGQNPDKIENGKTKAADN